MNLLQEMERRTLAWRNEDVAWRKETEKSIDRRFRKGHWPAVAQGLGDIGGSRR